MKSLLLAMLLSACGGSVDSTPACSAAFDACSVAEGALVQGDRCQAEVGPKGHYVDVTCPVEATGAGRSSH